MLTAVASSFKDFATSSITTAAKQMQPISTVMIKESTSKLIHRCFECSFEGFLASNCIMRVQ